MVYNNGRLQVPQILPPMWDLPKITVKQLIYNWFIGCKAERFFPLMILMPDHLKHLVTNKGDKFKAKRYGISDDNFGKISSIRRSLEGSYR